MSDEELMYKEESIDKEEPMYKSAYKHAREALSHRCQAVAIWNIPGYYVDAEGHLAAKRLMEADAQGAYASALVYRLTGDCVYADKAAELLDGWASVNQAFTDNDGPLVSAYLGTGLIKAAELLKPYSGWTAEARQRFAKWLKSVCLPAWDGIPGRNNWWNWSLYAQLALFQYLQDKAAFAVATKQLKEHLDLSLSEEGLIPEETVRGANGLWYHYFALAPTAAAAKLILDATGENLFHWISPNGKSLRQALETLLYYMDGRVEEWPCELKQNVPVQLGANTWPFDLFEAVADQYPDAGFDRLVEPHRPIIGHINDNSGFFLSHAWIYPTLMKGMNMN